MGKKHKKKKKAKELVTDRHLLYSASVQSVDADLDFFQRIYKRKRKKPFRLLREDFCGTAILACDWVRRNLAGIVEAAAGRSGTDSRWGRRKNREAPQGQCNIEINRSGQKTATERPGREDRTKAAQVSVRL